MHEGSLSPLSNRQTWTDSVAVFDTETNEPVDISTASEITVAVMPLVGADVGGGYSGHTTMAPLLVAKLSDGKVQHVEMGVFAFMFDKGQMRALAGGIYKVEITIDKDDETESLFLGNVPVREGVVQ